LAHSANVSIHKTVAGKQRIASLTCETTHTITNESSTALSGKRAADYATALPLTARKYAARGRFSAEMSGYFSPNTRMQPPQKPPVLALGTRMWALAWLITTEWAFGGAGMF